jgi:transposase
LQTIRERVALKNAKLTSEGQRVLQALQREYGMTQEAAKRLMRDRGRLFATAISVPVTSNERTELERLRRDNRRLRAERDLLKKAIEEHDET